MNQTTLQLRGAMRCFLPLENRTTGIQATTPFFAAAMVAFATIRSALGQASDAINAEDQSRLRLSNCNHDDLRKRSL